MVVAFGAGSLRMLAVAWDLDPSKGWISSGARNQYYNVTLPTHAEKKAR